MKKPSAIDLRIGDDVNFTSKNGKHEFFTIQKIEAFRDAYCDEKRNGNEGFVMAVNR